MAQLPEDVRSALRFFAFYSANGTLVMDLLEDFDYRSVVMAYGSNLEQGALTSAFRLPGGMARRPPSVTA